ncbi:MAG: carbonic anhydrase family protein [Deltaproteobacteria bacterium]|nr:carbonic anhydrase family protein [Deltaproteobacteria bacterium]
MKTDSLTPYFSLLRQLITPAPDQRTWKKPARLIPPGTLTCGCPRMPDKGRLWSLASMLPAAGTGSQQSPVDIFSDCEGPSSGLEFHYRSSHLNVEHTGFTAQVNYEQGSHITLLGQSFQLVQFHFHTPSEHLMRGEALDMELHLVHMDTEGRLAVVGVLFREGPPKDELDDILERIPPAPGQLDFPEITIRAEDFLPGERSFFTYMGSLTMLPYTEGVRWVVMKNQLTASRAQIQRLEDIFGKTARAVQPLNGRKISCSIT